jgi:hypothetical protein
VIEMHMQVRGFGLYSQRMQCAVGSDVHDPAQETKAGCYDFGHMILFASIVNFFATWHDRRSTTACTSPIMSRRL